jgi:hypothetical protein
VVIDDNPYICRNINENLPQLNVLTPHYHVIEDQHHQDVILIKTSVTDLKKEDFSVNLKELSEKLCK